MRPMQLWDNQKESLNAHDNLWFRCEDCDFKTRKKGYLKKHKQYQHEGMVFYKCDQCSYRSLKKPNFEFWQTHAGKGT